MEYYTSKVPVPLHAPYFTIDRGNARIYIGKLTLAPGNSFTIYGHHFIGFNDLLDNLHLFEPCTINTHPEFFI